MLRTTAQSQGSIVAKRKWVSAPRQRRLARGVRRSREASGATRRPRPSPTIDETPSSVAACRHAALTYMSLAAQNYSSISLALDTSGACLPGCAWTRHGRRPTPPAIRWAIRSRYVFASGAVIAAGRAQNVFKMFSTCEKIMCLPE